MTLPATSRSFSLIAALLLILSLALSVTRVQPTSAQAEPGAVQVNAVSTDGWPIVEATVTVLDASGQPVTGLTQDALTASAGGSSLPVMSVRPISDAELGIAVVFTFDVSGSMAGPPLEQAKLAGKSLLAQLKPSDVVAIVSFSDGVNVVQPFTGDREAAERAIDGLSAVGSTALYGGVQQSIDLANQAPLPRQAIVLLSDGNDYGGIGNADSGSTLAAAGESRSLIYTIGLGSEIDRGYLGALAQAGRGQFLQAPAPEDLVTLYDQTGQILRSQYAIALDASNANLPAGDATLVVTAAGTSGQLSFTVPAPPDGAVAATPLATVAATQPAQQQQTPSAQGGSSGFPWIIAVLVLAAGAAGIAGIAVVRRRRVVASPVEAQLERISRQAVPVQFPEISRAVPPADSRAWIEGPNGTRTNIGEAPLTIGFSSDCGLVLKNGGAEQLARARVWQRDGRFMLHNMSRPGAVSVAGRPASWVVLEDGDEITVGGCLIVFRNPF